MAYLAKCWRHKPRTRTLRTRFEMRSRLGLLFEMLTYGRFIPTPPRRRTAVFTRCVSATFERRLLVNESKSFDRYG